MSKTVYHRMRASAVTASLLLLLGMLAMPVRSQTANERVLTLDECIRIARTQSPSAKMAEKTFEVGYWSYRAFKSSLRPQVRLSGDAPGFTRRIITNIQDDGTQDFVSQNQAYSRLGFSLVQPITLTGGQLFLMSDLSRLDIFTTPSYVSWQSTPVSVGLRQPLVSYNTWKWSRRIQPIRYEIAERRYLEALEDIAIQATNSFFNLYIAEMRLVNAEFNLAINDSIYIISNGRYKVGKIAENDLLQTELQLLGSQQQVEQLKVQVLTATQELTILLGLPDGTKLRIIPPLDIPQVMVSEDIALGQALLNRSDVLDYEMRKLQAQNDLSQTRSDNRFSLDLNASYGLNQTGSTVNQAYTRPLNAQSFSVGINVPIIRWGQAHANIAAAEAINTQTVIQVEQDQRNFERNVRNEVKQFTLLSLNVVIANKADTIAQRRFEVSKSRYMIGKIDITNLQISQNEKDNSRSAYMSTLRDFWVGYYRLRRATLYDFIQGRQILMPPRSWQH